MAVKPKANFSTLCYTEAFTLHRSSDDADLLTTFSTIFTETTDSFEIGLAHDSTEFAKRQNLVDSGTSFYVRRTISGVNDPTFSETKDFAFTINFVDACRSANIVDSAITYPSVTWHADLTETLSVAAFKDSVDGATDLAGTGVYSTGLCGEKLVTLDPTIAFMTLTKDATDPVLNNFVIDYDQASATDSDVKLHTIGYTVTSKEYSALIPALTSSFSFEIVCPATITSSTLQQAM